jgi:hypothetical protein
MASLVPDWLPLFRVMFRLYDLECLADGYRHDADVQEQAGQGVGEQPPKTDL